MELKDVVPSIPQRYKQTLIQSLAREIYKDIYVHEVWMGEEGLSAKTAKKAAFEAAELFYEEDEQ